MRRVYIVNNSPHDFSDAERYGEITFLTSGSINKYATNNMVRLFAEAMVDSRPEDLIVLCSLNVMNAVACAVFAAKHQCINLLLYKDGRYIERNHLL